MNRIAATLALALAAVSLAGARGLAHAQDAEAIFDPLTMDTHTPFSKLDVDFAYVAYDEPANIDLAVIGLTFGGQYVSPQGFGGYLTVPMSYVSIEGTVNIPPFPPVTSSDSELSFGNVELGGLYSKYLTDQAAIVLHGGFALPTANYDANEDGAARGLQTLASSPRYGNLVQRVTNSSWLRLGGSAMGRVNKIFWRADLGVDLALDEDNSNKISPVFRVNLGGGIDLRTAHVLVEFVTNVTDDDNNNDDSASTVALGARFVAGRLRPGLAVLIPLDFDSGFEPDFAIALSLAARL